MEAYLECHNYQGMYTALDGREDPLLTLAKWRETFEGTPSTKAFAGHTATHVEELIEIAQAFIRIIQVKKDSLNPGFKNLRKLADGLAPKHFFGNKELWESFAEICQEELEKEELDSIEIDPDIDDTDIAILNADKEYAEVIYDKFYSAFNETEKLLNRKTAIEKPKIQINSAIYKVKSVLDRIGPSSPEAAETKKVVSELAGYASQAMSNIKDPVSQLNFILDALNKVNPQDHDSSTKDEVEALVKAIQKRVFDLSKEL